MSPKWKEKSWECARDRSRRLGLEHHLPIRNVLQILEKKEVSLQWELNTLAPFVHTDDIKKHAVVLNKNLYVVQIPVGDWTFRSNSARPIRVYCVQTNLLICELETESEISWTRFFVEGTVLAASSGSHIQLWDITNGMSLLTIHVQSVVALTMKDSLLAFTTNRNSTELWSLHTKTQIMQWEHQSDTENRQRIMSIAIAKIQNSENMDKHNIANMRVIISGDYCLPRIFEVYRDDPIFTLSTSSNPERNQVAYSMAVHKDTIVTGSLKGWIHTWSLSTSQHTRSFQSVQTDKRVSDVSVCNDMLCYAQKSDGAYQGSWAMWTIDEKDGEYTLSHSVLHVNVGCRNPKIEVTQSGEVVFFNSCKSVMCYTPPQVF